MKGLAKITDNLREISSILVENGYLSREEANGLVNQWLDFLKKVMKGEVVLDIDAVTSPLSGAVEIPIHYIRRKQDRFVGKKFLFYVPLLDAFVYGSFVRYDPLVDELVFYIKADGIMIAVSAEKTKLYMLDYAKEISS